MPGSYNGEDLAFRIANIQDQTYPESENRAPEAEITVPIRDDFRRHTLLGINIFGLEFFNQFDNILGVRKTDYMTGSDNGLPTAIAHSNQLAKEETADVTIESIEYADGQLTVEVKNHQQGGPSLPFGRRLPSRVPGVERARPARPGDLGLWSHQRCGSHC